MHYNKQFLRPCYRLCTFAGLVIVQLSFQFLLNPAILTAQTPSLVLEIEGGPVWQSLNEAEIPNDGTATRFSLVGLAGHGPWLAGRLYLTWNPAERHGFRVLLAPFSLTESSLLGEPVSFAGQDYDAGQTTTATYTFNSYRLSYRYRLHAGERTRAWVGFTAKIRDAQIKLEQETTGSQKDDLGFVPLLHLAGEWRFAPNLQLSLDADALAGGPGRAVDAALKLGYHLGDHVLVQAGYRMVEGGADVTEVYSFAWFHYAALSLMVKI